MKKGVLILVFVALISALSHAQVVSVIMDKTTIQQGEEILFSVKCLSEQDLEIVVFTEGHLVSTQQATLTPEENQFRFPSTDCPTGKYFVLVTGNAIHVEKEFVITEKK